MIPTGDQTMSLSYRTIDKWFLTAFTNHVAFWVIPHVGIDSQTTLEGPIEQVARVEAEEAENLLRDLGIPVQ